MQVKKKKKTRKHHFELQNHSRIKDELKRKKWWILCSSTSWPSLLVMPLHHRCDVWEAASPGGQCCTLGWLQWTQQHPWWCHSSHNQHTLQLVCYRKDLYTSTRPVGDCRIGMKNTSGRCSKNVKAWEVNLHISVLLPLRASAAQEGLSFKRRNPKSPIFRSPS